jgi:hypothetical protein
MLIKRKPLDDYIEARWREGDKIAIGYTVDEIATRPAVKRAITNGLIILPLVERGLTHADCMAMVDRAGIRLPEMYALGFNNANCKCCCKGGEGYADRSRQVFPEDFAEFVEIQESIGDGAYTFRNRKTGVRYGFRDVLPGAGKHIVESPECSLFCSAAEGEMA